MGTKKKIFPLLLYGKESNRRVTTIILALVIAFYCITGLFFPKYLANFDGEGKDVLILISFCLIFLGIIILLLIFKKSPQLLNSKLNFNENYILRLLNDRFEISDEYRLEHFSWNDIQRIIAFNRKVPDDWDDGQDPWMDQSFLMIQIQNKWFTITDTDAEWNEFISEMNTKLQINPVWKEQISNKVIELSIYEATEGEKNILP